MTDAKKKAGEKPKRETPAWTGGGEAASQQGREGGRLSRDVGTRDELKRAEKRPAGKTRVRKSDEEEDPS